MVTEIRIYIEGGGDSRSAKDELRRGYRVFLGDIYELASTKRIRCRVVMCGGRNSAFDDFKTAIQSHPQAFNVLLVDAEAPVLSAPWAHLQQRDGWITPSVPDKHCHLMVQLLEAWFLADQDALKAYYGQGFNANSIPGNPNVEQIAKATVMAAMENATRHTQKGKYQKIRDASRLLERISPAVVRAKSPHCDRLFTGLSEQTQ